MDQENKEPIGGEPSLSQSMVPPVRPTGNVKWYAVIVVLIMVIAGLAVLNVYHPAPAVTTANVTTTQAAIGTGQPYSFNITANGKFQNISVNFGDGTSEIVNYTNSNTVTVTHTYSSVGQYFIMYVINYGSSTSGPNLIPLDVALQNFTNYEASYGSLQLIGNSTSPVSSVPLLFGPGVNLTYSIGSSSPTNVNYQVINQSINIYKGNQLVKSDYYPYVFDYQQGAYVPMNPLSLYLNGLTEGYYTVELYTYTGVPQTQTINTSVSIVNTTAASYSSGQSVYYNLSVYGYSAGANYTTSYALSYLKGLAVENTANTNLTYLSNTNVTYSNGAKLSYPNMTSLLFPATNGFTLGGNTNITFLTTTNVTVSSATVKQKASNTTEYKSGDMLTFKNLSSIVIDNATSVIYATGSSTVNYTAMDMLEYLNGATTTYNANASVSYTNPSTMVTYTNGGKVNVTTTVTGQTQVTVPTGTVDPASEVGTAMYVNIPIYSKIALPTQTTSTFTSAENAAGGYTTLDPQIAYFTVNDEILANTLQTLVTYNGSSTSNFVPLLASQLPTTSNGGINTHYHNYTNKTPWGTTYVVNETPYQNYTFHINSNAKWEDGTSVTAWDVRYALTRDLLFASGSPGTPGWIFAQYALPGGDIGANSFYNITQNITADNSTNNVTIHFQKAMPASLVFQVLAGPGMNVASSTWLKAHGAGITWTTAGFAAYQSEAQLATYNTYVQNHIFSDGPYKVAYIVPGSEIVLVKNPNFVSPGPWDPVATINTVIIQWLSQPSTIYLELKSQVAQTGGIPTSNWNEVQSLQHDKIVNVYPFPTLSVYFYTFNNNINTTMLKTINKNANVPQSFFVNPNVRKAFSYAYNYSYYYQQQLGNAIYNETFLAPYTGMLPAGMLYNQSISDLTGKGISVPDANGQNQNASIGTAQAYWNAFMNGKGSDNATSMGVSKDSSGNIIYNKANLVIPIFIPQGDPVDLAAATTWGSALAKVIPGATFPVQTVTYYDLFVGYQVPGQVPMPINWGGWAPDYPYPTDYLLPMGMPVNSSTYMGADMHTIYWVGGAGGQNPNPNATEAKMLTSMYNAFLNATSNASNPSAAEKWFHVANEMLVNDTEQVYIGQAQAFWIMNSKINGNDVVKYQENVMIGGGAMLLYNFLSYNTTAVS